MTRSEKLRAKTLIKDNPLFNTLCRTCRQFEAKTEMVRLSPEVLFQSVIAFFDRIKENHREADEMCRDLWNETVCNIRDDMEESRKIASREEVELSATVLYIVLLFCMETLDGTYYRRLQRALRNSLQSHSPQWPSTLGLFLENIKEDDVMQTGVWLKRYIESDIFITDEYGRMEGIEADETDNNPNNYRIMNNKLIINGGTNTINNADHMEIFYQQNQTQKEEAKNYDLVEAEEVKEDNRERELPKVLSTPKAIALLDKLRAEGLLDDSYMPMNEISLTQKGIIAAQVADKLGIRNVWKTFGDFWGVERETMRSAFNDTINVNLKSGYNDFKDKIKNILKD